MSEENPPSRRPRPHRHPAPLLGALELATFRRGPFICLSGFHEVALGDAPVYDPDDFSSEDSDGERPAPAKAASAAKKKNKNKKVTTPRGMRPTTNDGGGGGGGEQHQAKRRKGKKTAAQEEEQEEEEEQEQEHWVHCDRCSRWRVVPHDFWPSVENDPRPHWFCEWARWDVRAQPPFEAACPQR